METVRSANSWCIASRLYAPCFHDESGRGTSPTLSFVQFASNVLVCPASDPLVERRLPTTSPINGSKEGAKSPDRPPRGGGGIKGGAGGNSRAAAIRSSLRDGSGVERFPLRKERAAIPTSFWRRSRKKEAPPEAASQAQRTASGIFKGGLPSVSQSNVSKERAQRRDRMQGGTAGIQSACRCLLSSLANVSAAASVSQAQRTASGIFKGFPLED